MSDVWVRNHVSHTLLVVLKPPTEGAQGADLIQQGADLMQQGADLMQQGADCSVLYV
jgi:hypothetical protein